MASLYDKLIEYNKSDYYGFHMPGHKRNEEMFGTRLPYGIDITEIEGFDDLHHAETLIKDQEERAAHLYKAEETHFLVNGSTVGILSAILGVTNRGDKILVARNCHKSVYNAMELNGLRPIYIYPEYEKDLQINGEVSGEKIEILLNENPDVKAVMIVSPTYDGVLSDVEKIAQIVHKRGIPLIVDEAHGAHFGFHPYFPENSNVKGADIVIHSVHKTLPSLTQTALIHINGEIVDREKVRKYLHMLQSSSPSYILMASIDRCMELLESEGDTLFELYAQRIDVLRTELQGLKHLEILQTEQFDRSKFLISVKKTGITSKKLADILLHTYHLQMEMTGGTYVLAMTALGDTKEGFERLKRALFEIDQSLSDEKQEDYLPVELPKLPLVCTNEEIERKKCGNEELILWKASIGRISTEYAYVYPPGIPLIVPGEQITQEAIQVLALYAELGFSVEGIKVENYIGVLKNG